MFHDIKIWARRLIRDVHAVYLAASDPRVPWYAKILAAAVAGYALSPIDLIPISFRCSAMPTISSSCRSASGWWCR
jgi:uncharacterized membrane protein YkvA (DUF1232 family)